MSTPPTPPPADKKTALRQRSLSTVALWGATLLMILSGWRTGSMILLGLFGILAQWEFYLIQRDKGLRVFKKWGVFCGVILYVGCWYLFLHAPAYAPWFETFEQIIMVALTIGVLIRLVLYSEPIQTPIVTVAVTLLGFFYVPFLFSFMAMLAFRPGNFSHESNFVLLYLIAVTKFCDAGAYVVGSLCGRHKLIPRISPGKTWEGFAGGLAASVGVSLLFQHLHPQGLPGLTARDAFFLGILLSLASVVGDLAESVVKRDAQIKDSGRFIPGIGGALDLIDSLLFTAPVCYFYVRFALAG